MDWKENLRQTRIPKEQDTKRDLDRIKNHFKLKKNRLNLSKND
jgi:hypothetical protein